MLKKLIHSAMALAFALGIAASTIQPAEAGRGGRVAAGVAAGIITLGVLGAVADANRRSYGGGYYGPACYQGPRECHWAGRRCYYNSWGDYVCRGGDYRCYRPTICD